MPLNLKVGDPNHGAARLFQYGLSGDHASRLFQTRGSVSPHGWLNRIEVLGRKSPTEGAREIVTLLEALAPPRAFVVRLLNPDHEDFAAVQDFFDVVVKPVVEDDYGYQLVVVDGEQAYEHARIDQEIFVKLHRSQVVLADITGLRPNCFLELGYALGRQLPTMLMVKDGTNHPFDITTFAGHHWKANGSAKQRREAFRSHWDAIKNRPPLVLTEPLIP